MIAKLTSKNQLTIPAAALRQMGGALVFEIEVRAGQLILTPMRLQRTTPSRSTPADREADNASVAAAMVRMGFGGELVRK